MANNDLRKNPREYLIILSKKLQATLDEINQSIPQYVEYQGQEKGLQLVSLWQKHLRGIGR